MTRNSATAVLNYRWFICIIGKRIFLPNPLGGWLCANRFFYAFLSKFNRILRANSRILSTSSSNNVGAFSMLALAVYTMP